jgi:hypothetical protein
MENKEILTYKNALGNAMIRRCLNCKHWSQELISDKEKELGYCKANPLLFAFTLKPTVFPITKNFYLCESHEFLREEDFKRNCEVLKQSEHIDRNK